MTLYLYGIVPADQPVPAETYKVTALGISAVVGLAPRPKRFALNPKFDMLKAMTGFQKVLEQACQLGPILPGAFDARFDNDLEILGFVTSNADPLRKALSTFGGLHQHQIEIRWDLGAALERFMNDERVLAARAESNRLKLGKNIQSAMDAIRRELSQDWLKQIGRSAEHSLLLPPSDENMAANIVLACQPGEPFFGDLEAMDEDWGDLLKIKIIGPMPAVSFATIGVDIVNRSNVIEAAELLGVTAGSPETVVRTAYRTHMKSAHPDVGGSVEAADAAKRAADLLIKVSGQSPHSDCFKLAALRQEAHAQAA